MTTTLSPYAESKFGQTFRALDWSWVKSSKALERYFRQLYLLWKYRIQLTPDRLADDVLHEHLSRPSFEQDMKLLFGQLVVHQPGVTVNAALTRDLFTQEFGAVPDWKDADCNIALTDV